MPLGDGTFGDGTFGGGGGGSTVTLFQPTLPPPVPFTEAELNFADEEPPRTYPENQDSNWGLLRKIFSDQMQDLIDQVALLYNEMFIQTSETLLDQHEIELGLPANPSGKTVGERRNLALAQVRSGLFTDQRLRDAIESFMTVTFGAAIQFSPSGMPFDPAGTPLYSGESGTLQSLYRIYYNPKNYSYEIWIKNTVGPDTVGLTRQLTRITPGGFSFTLDTTKTNVLDYFREVRNSQPIAHYTLANLNDSSGYGNTGTGNGSITVGGAASLTNPAVDAATTFDGVDDYISVPDFAGTFPYASQPTLRLSVEAWVKPTTAYPAALDYKVAWSKGGFSFGIKGTTGQLFVTGGSGTDLTAAATLALNSTYHIAFTYDQALGLTILYLNGVEVMRGSFGIFTTIGTAANIGRRFSPAGKFWQGQIGEVSWYDRILTPSEILKHYNTGINNP